VTYSSPHAGQPPVNRRPTAGQPQATAGRPKPSRDQQVRESLYSEFKLSDEAKTAETAYRLLR
jgi:hypothetical protein